MATVYAIYDGSRETEDRVEIDSMMVHKLINIPCNIVYLNCCYNELTELPETFPETLLNLNVKNNMLTRIGVLPASLLVFDCSMNRITEIQRFPPRLIVAKIGKNNLSHLPELPDSLEILDFKSNSVRNLDRVPRSLKVLDATDNPLATLPQVIPRSLRFLNVTGDNLVNLPDISRASISSVLVVFKKKSLRTVKDYTRARDAYLAVLRTIKGLERSGIPRDLIRVLMKFLVDH